MIKKKIVFAGNDIAKKLGIFGKAFKKSGYKTYSLAWFPKKTGSFCDEYIVDHHDLFHKVSKIKRTYVYLKYLFRLFILAFSYDVFFLSWPTMIYEIILLRLMGKKVYAIAAGNDIRDYDLDEIVNIYYDKKEDPKFYGRKKLKRNRRTAFFWGLFATKIICARNGTLSLYRQRKKTVDIIGYNFLKKSSVTEVKYNKAKRIKMVHAPSNKGTKGTKYIREAVERLKEAGYDFDYIELTNVPNTKVLEELKTSDIALCQVFMGGIGTFAHEAMNNGCMIVAYVLEFVRKRYKVPVYNVTIDDIYERLVYVLENPEIIAEYQRKSLDYFDQYIEESVAVKEFEEKLDLN